MSYWSEYLFDRTADELKFKPMPLREVRQYLPIGQGLRLPLHALVGPLRVRVGATLLLSTKSKNTQKEEGAESGSGGHAYQHIPLRVELLAPGKVQPFVWRNGTNKDGSAASVDIPWTEHVYAIDGSEQWPEGDWVCRVVNDSSHAVFTTVTLEYNFDRAELQTRKIPMRVINSGFAVALEALAPWVSFAYDKMRIRFNPDLKELTADAEQVELLADRVLPQDGKVRLEGELLSVRVGLASGAMLLNAMRASHQRKVARSSALTAIWDSWKQGWEERVSDSDPVIHAQLHFTDLAVWGRHWLTVNEYVYGGRIENVSIDIYLAFDRALHYSTHVLVLTPASYTHLAAVLDYLGWVGDPEQEMQDRIEPLLVPIGPTLGRYLGEFLVLVSERDSVFFNVVVEGKSWSMQHFSEPTRSPEGSAGWHRRQKTIRLPPHVPGPVELPTEPTTSFDLDPQGLASLDKIRTIVVLMMENRSYDHLIGFLKKTRGPQYDGINPDAPFVNPPARPLIAPVAMLPAASTQIGVSPHHSFGHVVRQVADGQMTGFAADYSELGDQYIAMSYYKDTQLPVYHQLAASYAVCNYWFASHPGPTFPNRFATVTGRIPELENFDSDDPRLGWSPYYTIFELLDQHRIAWRYFEGDFAFLRTFSRFRLDDEHVIPFSDPEDGFDRYLDSGSEDEPRVIFIDPNFVDLPPVGTANDDHAPADLTHGQDLVCTIYNRLIRSPRWKNTLFLITYDEHGGFFDHVPPPGTSAAPPERREPYPVLHPGGPTYLGARVPAFIVSPWVAAGATPDIIFEHASIIKTILARFRLEIPEAERGMFGPRVNDFRTKHLGVPLLEPGIGPRSDEPTPCPQDGLPWLWSTRRSSSPTPAMANLPDLHRLGVDARLVLADSKRREARELDRSADRLTAKVEQSVDWLERRRPEEEPDADDFRVLVRRAFVPRRRQR